MNTTNTTPRGTTAMEIIKVRSTFTGVTFTISFPDATKATDWIIDTTRPIVLVEASMDVQGNLQAWDERDVVYCSICDGVGHGQPGHGPCPLEDRGWADYDPREGGWL